MFHVYADNIFYAECQWYIFTHILTPKCDVLQMSGFFFICFFLQSLNKKKRSSETHILEWRETNKI